MNAHASQAAVSARAKGIIEEATTADGTPPISDQALLAVAQGKRELIELEHAVGIVGEGEIDLVVRPSSRGQGIGRQLLHELLSRADRTRQSDLRAWAHGENAAATSLLQAEGFISVRELLRMSLDPALLARGVEHARALPRGFAIVAFNPANGAHADDWVRVNSRAFANHPEQGAVTRADFDALTQEPWFDAEDLRLAYSTEPDHEGVLAGFTWVKTVQSGEVTETELYVLGADPSFSGIGLGAALLGETMRRMQQHRPGRITLYVDGDNTNAVELYERAGFEVEQRSVQYLRRRH